MQMDARIERDGFKLYRLVDMETGATVADNLTRIAAGDLQNRLWRRQKTRPEESRQLTAAEWQAAWQAGTIDRTGSL